VRWRLSENRKGLPPLARRYGTRTDSDAGTPECLSVNQCDNQNDQRICCKVKVYAIGSADPDAAYTSSGACLSPPCVLGVQLCADSRECLDGNTCDPVQERCVPSCLSIVNCAGVQICCDNNGAGYCATGPCPLFQRQRCVTSWECAPGRICGSIDTLQGRWCIAADAATPLGWDASSDAAGDGSSSGAGDASSDAASDVIGDASSESALIEEASADAGDVEAATAIADAAYDANGP
jgi:hypothetical protein